MGASMNSRFLFSFLGLTSNSFRRYSIGLFLFFLFLLNPFYVFADSSGMFCFTENYLAYEMFRGDNDYLHVIRFGSNKGIEKPIYLKMNQGTTHGIKCESGKVKCHIWNRIDVYDISDPQTITFVRSENQQREQLPLNDFSSSILGFMAEPMNIILKTTGKYEYDLIIERQHFYFTESKLIQKDINGNLIKSLKLFEGFRENYAYDFDVQDFNKKVPPTSKINTYKCDIKSISNILIREQENLNVNNLIDYIQSIEKYINCSNDEKNNPIALFFLGLYKEKIAEIGFGYSNDEKIIDFLKDHLDDFHFDEISGSLLFSGKDWKILKEKYPNSDYAAEVAYKITELPRGGECEGHIDCYVERQFEEIKDFLIKYPNSKFTEKAVNRANKAFNENLKRLKDINSKEENYDPDNVKKVLRNYDEIASGLPPKLKDLAYETIAAWWFKFNEYDRARELCSFILTNYPQKENVTDIKKLLDSIPIVKFILHEATANHYTQVNLKWDKPEKVGIIKSYEVYRSDNNYLNSEGISISGYINPNQNQYSDCKVESNTEYWYKIKANIEGQEFFSNVIRYKTPSKIIIPQAMIFDQTEKSIYVFGNIDIGTPEIIKISDDGRIRERISGTFYGVRTSGQIHKKDEYVGDYYFIDPIHQSFLKFSKKDPDYGDKFEASIFQGEIKELDRGVIVSINPLTKQMWISESEYNKESLAWDYENGICWKGIKGAIELYDKDNKLLKQIDLPFYSNASKIFIDSSNKSIWAYLSQGYLLVKINQLGEIVSNIKMDWFARTGFQNIPMVIDFKRKFIWYAGSNCSLLKMSFNGESLLIVPENKLYKSNVNKSVEKCYLALDEENGFPWILNENKLVKLSVDGTVFFETEITSIYEEKQYTWPKGITCIDEYPSSATINTDNQVVNSNAITTQSQAPTISIQPKLPPPTRYMVTVNRYILIGAMLVVLVLALAVAMVRRGRLKD